MNIYSDLNSKEKSVLQAISCSSKSNGGDFTDFADTMKMIQAVDHYLTAQQLKGYISQLSQKGYISVEEGTKNPMICAGKYVDFLTHYEF